MKATPRPWFYDERVGQIAIHNVPDYKGCTQHIPLIISFMGYREIDDEGGFLGWNVTEQDKANAKLIVKAVNNYDELVILVEDLIPLAQMGAGVCPKIRQAKKLLSRLEEE